MRAVAPFNYPLNEMYAILIPALLMGNVAVLKLPAVSGRPSTLHQLAADGCCSVIAPRTDRYRHHYH